MINFISPVVSTSLDKDLRINPFLREGMQYTENSLLLIGFHFFLK